MLQSTATPDLCFLALPVLDASPDYQVQLTADDRAVLGLDETGDPSTGADLAVLALVAVHRDGKVSVNLMSPVVVNRANRRAVQAVRWDGVYSHDYPLSLLPVGMDGQEQSCS